MEYLMRGLCELVEVETSRTYEKGIGVVKILSRPVRASTSWFSVVINMAWRAR